MPSRDLLTRAPKVLLHDHLDGGLRPETVVDLAAEAGHALPAQDPDALRRWFEDSADSGSLERYLETFDHTVAVMQTRDQLRRVARECVLDLAADGVVYAEVRYAPSSTSGAGSPWSRSWRRCATASWRARRRLTAAATRWSSGSC